MADKLAQKDVTGQIKGQRVKAEEEEDEIEKVTKTQEESKQ